MRTFFGVVFALLALVAGGCSLAFSPMIQNFDDFLTIWSLGGIPALIFGYIAWQMLRRSKPVDPLK